MQWILLILAALPAAGQALVPAVCAGCHNSLNAMGGLDLAALPRRFEDRSVRERWIRVYDRVAKGEMPPKGVPFGAAQRAAMLDPLRRAIYEADHAEVVRDGRGSLRAMVMKCRYPVNSSKIHGQLRNADGRRMAPHSSSLTTNAGIRCFAS